jgi:L-ascorbate metabolism protein UlaG (beta-lactamase superfamily)
VEIQFYGANCVRLTTKKAQIVVDDNLSEVGRKAVTKPQDISLRTSMEIPEFADAKFSAESPGEYEVSGAIIHGVAARGHMDEEGKLTAVIYTVTADDVKVAIAGHIHPDLSDDQAESIGLVDVLIVPVGGNGYTLDGVGALQVIKKLEPKLVIPTHYADKDIKYEVPQAELAEALKGMAMEPSETVAKLKVKPGDLSDTAHLIVLERQ